MIKTQKRPYFNFELKTLHLNTLKGNNIVTKVFPELYSTEVDIFLTAISKPENVLVDHYLRKDQTDEVKEEIKKVFPHINLDKVLANGNGNEKASSYSSLLQKKPVTNNSASMLPFYRNYEVSYEKWYDNPYVNMCPEGRLCYESALRKLGAKGVHGMNNIHIPFYTVLWIGIRASTMHNEKV